MAARDKLIKDFLSFPGVEQALGKKKIEKLVGNLEGTVADAAKKAAGPEAEKRASAGAKAAVMPLVLIAAGVSAGGVLLSVLLSRRRGGGVRGAPLSSERSPPWPTVAPRTVAARRALYDRCGEQAFLAPDRSDPGKSRYPVMAATGACELDCRGAFAALERGRAAGDRGITMAATAALARAGCRGA